MGRSVEGQKPGKPYPFTPRSFGNDKDPDPIVFTLLSPTEADKRELVFLRTEVAGRLVDAPTNEVLEACARRYVQSVTDNYEVRGQQITDGESLATHGEQEFLLETYLHVLGALKLSESAKKDSSPQSDSTSPGTQLSPETADDAPNEESTKVVDACQAPPE